MPPPNPSNLPPSNLEAAHRDSSTTAAVDDDEDMAQGSFNYASPGRLKFLWLALYCLAGIEVLTGTGLVVWQYVKYQRGLK